MLFIIDMLFASNKYFNDQEPWKKKNDKDRLNTIVYTALELIRKISILLNPVIPDTSLKVLNIFDISKDAFSFEQVKDHNFLKKDIVLKKLEILFKKIDK